jgi:putative colanic acid biosynthesis acetyltransferase WcaF
MGNYSVLSDDVDCYTMNKVVIGHYSTVSQRAFLCCGSHDIGYKNIPLITKPIIIGSYVWVCSEAFISPGVTIGDYAVVAARAVVTRDIEGSIVVGGNPAKFLKNRVVSEE